MRQIVNNKKEDTLAALTVAQLAPEEATLWKKLVPHMTEDELEMLRMNLRHQTNFLKNLER